MDAFQKSLRQYFSEEQLQKIQSVRIGIAGAGGLGSNCAMSLVRSGFKHLKIIDFDRVEISNLNRQFYFLDQIGQPKVEALKNNLQKINPAVKIEPIELKIKVDNLVELFKDCQIVVEAFDLAELKSLLVEKLLPLGKFIVSGSGMAGIGKSDQIKVHSLKPNLFVVGDLSSEVSGALPPFSPRVNIVAAKQADVILEYVLSKN